jgi:hypothetical protein
MHSTWSVSRNGFRVDGLAREEIVALAAAGLLDSDDSVYAPGKATPIDTESLISISPSNPNVVRSLPATKAEAMLLRAPGLIERYASLSILLALIALVSVAVYFGLLMYQATRME